MARGRGGLATRLRVASRSDEPDPSCERHVEIEGLLEAVDVVEANAVGVVTSSSRRHGGQAFPGRASIPSATPAQRCFPSGLERQAGADADGVFTDEDRRKAADVTNEIKREKRAIFERERLNEYLEKLRATQTARRARNAAKQRRRREEQKARATIERRFPSPPEPASPAHLRQVHEARRPFDSDRYSW
jgi:hypothetical protein